MTTANAAATLKRADDFAADFATATLVLLDGVTPLATHTLAGFTTSNDGNDGLATADAIATATIAADGAPDNATLTAAGRTYAMTVGVAAPDPADNPDIVVSTDNYLTGQDSAINSLVFRFPAA